MEVPLRGSRSQAYFHGLNIPLSKFRESLDLVHNDAIPSEYFSSSTSKRRMLFNKHRSSNPYLVSHKYSEAYSHLLMLWLSDSSYYKWSPLDLWKRCFLLMSKLVFYSEYHERRAKLRKCLYLVMLFVQASSLLKIRKMRWLSSPI